MTCARVRREGTACSRAATRSMVSGLSVIFGTQLWCDQDVRKLNGGYPTRCHSSVSMWPEGGRGFSNDVKAGKVLKRIIFDPALPVTRSNSFIIEARRT